MLLASERALATYRNGVRQACSSNWHAIPRISSWIRSPFDAVVNETCEDIPRISIGSLREGTGSSLPRQFLTCFIIVTYYSSTRQTGPHSERTVQVQLASWLLTYGYSDDHLSFF